ncbi:MAG: MBOAT family protein [Verrucomicrobia bacterium]|nr:MBOAT family protein [Verrucomicrobiota bacterium]
MLFHTWTFAVFFAVTWTVFIWLKSTRFSNIWLLIVSYVFYGWWHPYYLILILFSTLVDYGVVRAMDRCTPGSRWSRRFWLYVSLVNNLGTLAFFKYAGFIVANINSLLGLLSLNLVVPPPQDWMPFGWDYLLPVGISFYTFQSMSYTIDYYRGHLPMEKSFVRFATYVAFFPQLVAGPIERASRLLPQFHSPRSIRLPDIYSGAWLFLVGLFKKLALANYLGIFIEQVFAFPDDHTTADLVSATFLFAWQIYFDFSGYSDMARGIAKSLGFDLCLNFNHPYMARNISEFWQRWHISLSTWFRDYVYIPLGGNRVGVSRIYLNLLITFVISGIWHGANWTFVAWGLWHGLGICVTRFLSNRLDIRLPGVLSTPAVFLFSWVGWVFFRSESLAQAGYILRRIFTTQWGEFHVPTLMILLVFIVWAYQCLCEMRHTRALLQSPVTQIILGTAMLLYLFLGSASGGAFIYFQF